MYPDWYLDMKAAQYLGVSYYDIQSWVPFQDKARALVAWNSDEYGDSEVERRKYPKS